MKDIITFKTMIGHLMVILDKKQRLQMVGMMFVIIIGSLFELLGVSAMLPFIQGLLTPEVLEDKPYIRFFSNLFRIADKQSIIVMVGVGIVIIYVIKNLYLSFSSYLQVSHSNNIRRQLSVMMLRSYMERPYAFFVENGSGVILRGVNSDIDGVYLVVSNLFKTAAEMFTVATIAIYLFVVDTILAVGVLIIGLMCMLTIVLGIKKKLTKLSHIYREAAAKRGKCVTQINDGIKDIMVFNRRRMFVDRYDRAYEQANIAEIRSTFANLIPERIIEASCVSGIIFMLLVRINMGVDPSVFVPEMAVFAMGAFRLLPSISRLTGYASTLIFSRPMLEATYENIISAREYSSTLSNTVIADIDNASLSFKSTLEARDIDWKYRQGKDKVLNGLRLTIQKGESIGIIGESGSGKSTLADLFLGLYRPQMGGIYMDGIEISEIPNTWSRVVAYVPQSVFLMDDSIRANVVFGADKADDNDVWEALSKASIDAFVRGLPEGLDTVVGERGVKLSGGQRQRIAIARALFIKPQIMILDEATSALDNETEESVMEAVDSLAGSMTLIIIAHRITTLRNCDKIYEIISGKAVERNKDVVKQYNII